ncbi:hypothetical protein GF326_12855 [Candidatus Bathyarchaeota archaeon]|nr:hypothetical protein [Candidatus Bathyarchaeota archaeon]
MDLDILMGHARPSAKGNYSFSTASIVRIYREQIYPKLAINGWNLKQKAVKVESLAEKVEKLSKALTSLELENNSYKTRIDNMQTQLGTLVDKTEKQGKVIDSVKESFRELALANEKMHREYDLLQIWISGHENDELVREYKEMIEKFRMNWDE